YVLRAKLGAGDADLTRAVELNALAERIAGEDTPRAVWEQRAALFRRLNKPEEADRATARAKEAPLQTGRAYFLSGTQALPEGRLREARELLVRAVELDPADFWAHTALGAAYQGLGQDSAAAACYDTAIALQPGVSWGYYSRGLLAHSMQEHE